MKHTHAHAHARTHSLSHTHVYVTHCEGPGRYATLDAMEVGNGGMSLAEQQAIFSIYALVKTPLYIGADVTTLVGDTLAVYTNAATIAWNQDSLGKPGRQLRPNSDPGGELWGGPLSGGAAAVVMLNRGGLHRPNAPSNRDSQRQKRSQGLKGMWRGAVIKYSA